MSIDNSQRTLTTVKGDIEKAAEYKARLATALSAVCDIISEAKINDKLDLSFQLGVDGIGRQHVMVLKVTKEL